MPISDWYWCSLSRQSPAVFVVDTGASGRTRLQRAEAPPVNVDYHAKYANRSCLSYLKHGNEPNQGPTVDLSLLRRLNKSQPRAAIDGLPATFVRQGDALFRGLCSLLLIATLGILLALVTRFPHYEMLSQLPKRVENQAMSWQVHHPLTPIPADLKDVGLNGWAASHVDKMELRLTVPLLGCLSGTGIWTVVIWTPIAAMLLFYLLALCGRDATGDTTAAAFFVIGFGATFFGSWGFNDFICGDAVAFALTLLSACCLRRPWLSGLCLLGAAFCDERSVIAAPLLLLYFIVRCAEPAEKTQRNQLLFAILGTIGVWVLLRWWLSATFHLAMGTSFLASWDTFRGHLIPQTLFSLVGIFRASWIIPVLAVRNLILHKDRMLATALVAAFGIAIVPAFLVVDLNRSICYSFMIFFISLRLLRHNANYLSNKYLAAIMLINILISPPSKTILRFLI